jgi:hypothetical protein
LRKPRSAGVKLLGVLVLALGGFALATVITGVGFATDTPSSSSSSSSTDGTTTITTTTTTTTSTTTTTTPPPPGQEGCTPGFWKQPQHFDSWPDGVTPDMLVGDVFTAATGAFADATLLEALSFQGGSGVGGATEILLRAAVAAYLNSFAVDYPLTTTEVVDQVNAALASGVRSTMLALATTLDANNNGISGCPLS